MARNRRAMTMATLASICEVTARTVTRWESGDAHPSQDSIQTLAKALDFDLDFFFQRGAGELPVGAVSFRALSKTSAGLRNSAIAAGQMSILIADWINERFRLPNGDLPTFTSSDPDVAARMVRERWGLGTMPIPNLVHLLESHGVRVFSLSEDIVEVDAFSFYMNGTPFILVNQGKTAERQRFDLAHELGHLVMHCDHQVTSSREAEYQAQRFAAEFLMPMEDLISRPLWNVEADAIVRAKKRWRVSAMALAHRLRDLKMLTEWGYRDACVSLAHAGYRRSEPGSGLTAETSQVFQKVFRALRDRGLNYQSIGTDLGIKSSDVLELMFHLAPSVVLGGGQVELTPSRAHLELVRDQSEKRALPK